MREILKKLQMYVFGTHRNNTVLRFPVLVNNKTAKKQEFAFQRLPVSDDCCDGTKNTINGFLNTLNSVKTTYKEEIGRGTWKLLHAIAENYKEKPTKQEQTDAKQFIHILADLYPCEDCKENFKKILSTNPPNVTSRLNFCRYICKIHNMVNQKIGKNVVNCNELYKS